MIKRICLYCKKDFFTYKAWLRGGKYGKFCSIICADNGRNYKRKNYRIKKICLVCKNEFIVKRYRKNIAFFCSIPCLAKDRGIRMRNENHPNWKGGITERPYKSKKWAREIKKRDKYKCRKCGSCDNINAHHIREWSKCVEKRYEIENGITLCEDCHYKEHINLNFIKHKSIWLNGYRESI